jgi:ComF family protein
MAAMTNPRNASSDLRRDESAWIVILVVSPCAHQSITRVCASPVVPAWNCCGNRPALYFGHQVQLEFLFAGPRGRLVFSESVKDVELGIGGPPASTVGAASGWRALSRALQRTNADLANAFFPSDCRVCGGPILNIAQTPVCEACAAGLKPQANRESLCIRCGEAPAMESLRFRASIGASECSMCRLAPPEFTRAVAFSDYDEQVRELFHLLKFNGMRRIARSLLGAGMAEAVLQLHGQTAEELLVVPVPLYSARERSRGFNQAGLLAHAALSELRRTQPAWRLHLRNDILLRVKDTNASFGLNPSQRRKGLAGAFRASAADAVRDREVLLIDDILTTGATARECAKVLLRAGAAKVWVATYARAQEDAVVAETSFARWDAPTATVALIEPETGKQQRFVQ